MLIIHASNQLPSSHSVHRNRLKLTEFVPSRSPRKKLMNVGIIALMAVLPPLASSMFTPGIAQIAKDLHTTEQLIIATTTGFVIMLGIGPLALAPLSETFGRRAVYIACFTVFTLLQIPTALAPNVKSLIVVRTISGFFGSMYPVHSLIWHHAVIDRDLSFD